MSRRWNSHEDVKLNHLVRQQKNWKDIVKHFPGKNEREIRARYLHRFTNRLQKLWTPDEDQKLVNHYYKFGFSKWMMVARQLSRSVRECKDRWVHFIGPQMEDNGVRAQLWSESEDCEILRLYQLYGPKWVLMSNQLRSRSPEEIRCRWETKLRRRFKYSQSAGKAAAAAAAGFGIRVTVVRKGQKPEQQQQQAVVQRRPLRQMQQQQQVLAVKARPATSSAPMLQPVKVEPLPELALAELESDLCSIMDQPLPDGEELKDLTRLDVDIADILGFPLDDNDLLLESAMVMDADNMENVPPPAAATKPTCSEDCGARDRLTLPVDEALAQVPEPPANSSRRKRKRKQFTSSRYSCSSSPSPTMSDSWPGHMNPHGEAPEGDDREAFIKRFKLEVERDFTELQLKGSSRKDDRLLEDDPFSDKENAPVASANGLVDSVKEQYDVSKLVSPMKSAAPQEFSSNSVLDLASEVENSSPPAKRRIVCSRFARRHSYADEEERGFSSRRLLGCRPGSRRAHNSEAVNRAILEEYNPVRFAFRRVLQIGHDRGWRHVALGTSRAQSAMTSQAHAFLRRHNYVV